MAPSSSWSLEKAGEALPTPQKQTSPKPNYLSLEDAETLARQLCKVPITVAALKISPMQDC
jgi:hypothetical protein